MFRIRLVHGGLGGDQVGLLYLVAVLYVEGTRTTGSLAVLAVLTIEPSPEGREKVTEHVPGHAGHDTGNGAEQGGEDDGAHQADVGVVVTVRAMVRMWTVRATVRTVRWQWRRVRERRPEGGVFVGARRVRLVVGWCVVQTTTGDSRGGIDVDAREMALAVFAGVDIDRHGVVGHGHAVHVEQLHADSDDVGGGAYFLCRERSGLE